jgi:Uma2 family endonuclease
MASLIQPIFREPDTGEILYPDSDGEPMAENTIQYRYLTTIKSGLEILFRDRPDVFVAGDLLWYPVEGKPEISAAPDVFVAFGRPKRDRGSYKQFVEENIAPQVVFEIVSPGSRKVDHSWKYGFYDRYGAEEYYVYEPDRGRLTGWLRESGALRAIPQMQGWVSPRLGVRFELTGNHLDLYSPDGWRFRTDVELADDLDRERQRAEEERQRAERLAARLRELGIDPEG